MSATSEGTMTAAEAPATACPAIAQSTEGESSIIGADTPKETMTIRKMRTQPTRWPSFAPVITSVATARPYTTMVELMVVGGTPKSPTMPPSDTGSAVTLNDMRTCPRKGPTIGIQERCSS